MTLSLNKINKKNGELFTENDVNKIDINMQMIQDMVNTLPTSAVKEVISSEINGNIVVDGVETQVYVHPSGTNPHGTTKTDIGLGNVDNTSDLSKPISTSTQNALDEKVDKIVGKQLSTEDYTTIEKNKLANLFNYDHTNVDDHMANTIIHVTQADKDLYSDKYTKNEIDNKISAVVTSLDYKEHVATFADLSTTYTNAQEGWTVSVDADDITYKYSDGTWIPISANSIPLASSSVDGKMSKQDKVKIDSITGTNTGDETQSTIKTKLGSASNSSDGYLTSTDWNTFNNKAKINDNLTTSVNDTYSIDKIISLLANKQNKIMIQSTQPTDLIDKLLWIQTGITPLLFWEYDSSTTSFKQIGSSGGGISIDDWISGQNYNLKDFVINNLKLFRCKVANSDTNFDSSKWDEIGGGSSSGASGVGQSTGGLGSEIFNDYINNTISGQYSHAEGTHNIINGDVSHVEGKNNVINAPNSHISGTYNLITPDISSPIAVVDTPSATATNIFIVNTVSGFTVGQQVWTFSLAGNGHNKASITAIDTTTKKITLDSSLVYLKYIIGITNNNDAMINTIDGGQNLLIGKYSKISGYQNYGKALYTEIGGYNNTVTADYVHAKGFNNKALTQFSHIEGYGNLIQSGSNSHLEGNNNISNGESIHIEGTSNQVTGAYSNAEGAYNLINSSYSSVYGYYNITNNLGSTVMGQYCKTPVQYNNGTSFSSSADALTIGCGTSDTSRANAFRATFAGKLYCLQAYSSTGADYAEWFEWLDDNELSEDRIGKFVTLIEDRITIANSTDDYILGIVSGNPSVIGDAQDDSWVDMYVRDEFGRLQYEDVEVEAVTKVIPEISEIIDGEKVIIKSEEKIIIKPSGIEHRIKLNPEYDSSREYIPRSQRKEWSCVGMMGKLIVYDDGTCEVNGYCKSGDNGIATKSESGYRVMKRVSNNIVQVLVK